MVERKNNARLTFFVACLTLLVAQAVECKELVAAPNYPGTLKCVYFVMDYGASISFETLNGKTQFTVDEPFIQALQESPNISDDTFVKCLGNPALEKGVKLGALYELGYRLSAIKRQHLVVNNEAVPLPSWDYELKRIEQKNCRN